jgi:large subunit ribosomal protein L25
MKSVELKAISRNEVRSKSALRTLRKEGRIPAVIYGGKENLNLHVDLIEFEKLINTSDVFFLDLKMDDKTIKVVIQDVQFHPLSDNPIHIDFVQVFDDKMVTIGVPVTFTGSSIGVLNGGKKREKLRKLVLKALPSDLPEVVSIDISKVKIGQSIKVKDIDLGKVEKLDNENAVIVAVKTSRVAVDVDELDEEEGEEGEESTEEGAEKEAAAE